MDFPYPPGVRRNNLNTDIHDTSPQYSSNFNYNGATSSQSIKRWSLPRAKDDDPRKDNVRKVQVAEEEKATQRVQVNAGYENPEIICLGSTCSGVFLRYGLIVYGTSELAEF
jgi:hypothetical protein